MAAKDLEQDQESNRIGKTMKIKHLAAALAAAAVCVTVPGTAFADQTCKTGILESSSDSFAFKSITGYFGQGYVAVSFQNPSGPVPVTVSIVDESGGGNRTPNQTPSETAIGMGSSYTFGYWGGLNGGGTRKYDFRVRVGSPLVNGIKVPYQVISNRC
ncbi:hypothetical protein ACFWNN_02660 [Lentzea sp. NPDC058450]|uniref:hypothetical protein n=1 Tax=Lentzea sp. NPDC058450 TaxID=3346505 RepID=UPI00366512BC